MGHPPNPGVGYLVGICSLFSWKQHLTPWLGFQASEAYLIKKSSWYREARQQKEGSEEKSQSANLDHQEHSTPPAPPGLQQGSHTSTGSPAPLTGPWEEAGWGQAVGGLPLCRCVIGFPPSAGAKGSCDGSEV